MACPYKEIERCEYSQPQRKSARRNKAPDETQGNRRFSIRNPQSKIRNFYEHFSSRENATARLVANARHGFAVRFDRRDVLANQPA